MSRKSWFALKTGKKDEPNRMSMPVRIEMSQATSTLVSTKASSINSSRVSLYPDGDFRNYEDDHILEIRVNMMATYIYQDMIEKMWAHKLPGEGVVIKKRRGEFVCCPKDLQSEKDGLFAAVKALNVRCAMTVNTHMINIFTTRLDVDSIPLSKNLRIQVLPTIQDLACAQKHHYAAFITDPGFLVVWDDSPDAILKRAEELEQKLVMTVWNEDHGESTEKSKEAVSSSVTEVKNYDDENVRELPRSTRLNDAVMVGLSLCLLLAAIAAGYSRIAREVAVDKSFIRVALVLYAPITAFLALFFMQVIVVHVAEIFGPIGHLYTNSKTYSAVRSPRLQRNHGCLPHMTIQCPVYLEDLESVIKPTVFSLKAAISTYEMQGGTANIFMNDDGMQVLTDEQAQARQDFYAEHNIGWVARPRHNPNPAEGETAFVRRGKFKKASNMNYALMISLKVEEKLERIHRPANWSNDQESLAYEQCLQEVLMVEGGRAWADGNIRMGDYILLVDSDTRVPLDCFLDAASEMEASPDVAILQYTSGVMQVANDFFENGITFFTNLVYTAIKFGVANGGPCPFVGHNAVLRWSALQEIVYQDEDGYDKFWSESHVSEDFEIALKLQCLGYTIRLGTYHGDGFKEGVSLTVYDEVARWEKYAYGCNELLFHPLRYWLTRGPFTPLFRKFIGSNIHYTAKITIMGYIGTYYAIGTSWILTFMNYFLIGWFAPSLDHFYLDSFKIYVSLVFVFNLLGNVALAVLRYRLKEQSLFHGLVENFKWVPMMTIFFGGISIHVSSALLSHMFSIPISWSATAKEVKESSFFEEIPKIFAKFKFTFVYCAICIAAMLICAVGPIPYFWHISNIVSCYPLSVIVVCHFLLPTALNPALMKFSW